MSTTTNLKLFKHDNPTTNTNQFDVEKALNENWDKIDKNAGEVASKIQTLENTTNAKDTSQDAEIEVLKAENALLKSQIPSATVVGETIHLEDSSNMQCQISPIGASKQDTREGYNKFNLEKWFNNAVASSCTKTLLRNGVKLDFTAGADAFIGSVGEAGAVLVESVRGGLTEVKALTEYTISLSSVPKCYIGYWDENYVSLGYAIINNAKMTFTTPVNCKYIFVRVGIQDSNYTTYSFTDIQIVEGTEEKPYEQHGASPSIEHEAPIESVGDNINVLPNKATTQTINGVVFTVNSDGTVIANGTATANTNLTVAQNTELNDGEEYILSGCPTGGSDTKYAITMNQYYSSASHFTQDYGNGASFTYNKLSANSNSVYIRIVSGATVENLMFKPKISKKVAPYSPYGQGGIEIYSYTQNLFDKTKTSKAIGSASGYVSTEYIPAVTGDTIAKSNATSLFLYDKTKTQITNVGNWTNKVIDIENVAYVRCNVLETDVDTFMLVKNQDLPSEYIQGRSQTKAIYTQQPFRAIGDVKDRFVKVDGVWYEEHKIGLYTFTGNEIWYINSNWANKNAFFAVLGWTPKLVEGFVTKANLMCNYFKVYTPDAISRLSGSGIGQGSGNAVYISAEGITTISDLKTWLSTNNVELYYELETPTLIECTPEQVEVLESFNTYKNITNISSDSIGELEVFYYKDLETLLGGV